MSDLVFAAIERRWKAGEPLKLDEVAAECGIRAEDVIRETEALVVSGRLTFTGHSGMVPVLHVIEGDG